MSDSIAQKLSWELVAMSDLGEDSTWSTKRLALEICYGVSLTTNDLQIFADTMENIAKQVSDPEMQRLLRLYANRGLKQ